MTILSRTKVANKLRSVIYPTKYFHFPARKDFMNNKLADHKSDTNL